MNRSFGVALGAVMVVAGVVLVLAVWKVNALQTTAAVLLSVGVALIVWSTLRVEDP